MVDLEAETCGRRLKISDSLAEVRSGSAKTTPQRPDTTSNAPDLPRQGYGRSWESGVVEGATKWLRQLVYGNPLI